MVGPILKNEFTHENLMDSIWLVRQYINYPLLKKLIQCWILIKATRFSSFSSQMYHIKSYYFCLQFSKSSSVEKVVSFQSENLCCTNFFVLKKSEQNNYDKRTAKMQQNHMMQK